MTADRTLDNARMLESFTSHERAVRRYLVRCLRNPNEVSDLSQEVWLRLLRIENLEGVNDPRAFLIGIAANVFAQWRRETAVERKYVTTDSELIEQEGEQLSAQEVADCLALDRLERALGRLSATQRDVLILVKKEGWSCEEVADRLNLSIHTVRKYLPRAMAKVRRLLALI